MHDGITVGFRRTSILNYVFLPLDKLYHFLFPEIGWSGWEAVFPMKSNVKTTDS